MMCLVHLRCLVDLRWEYGFAAMVHNRLWVKMHWPHNRLCVKNARYNRLSQALINSDNRLWLFDNRLWFFNNRLCFFFALLNNRLWLIFLDNRLSFLCNGWDTRLCYNFLVSFVKFFGLLLIFLIFKHSPDVFFILIVLPSVLFFNVVLQVFYFLMLSFCF